MVDGDRDRMELAYCLTWSLPGTPVLYYGEEVGQLEDLSIPGRLSVRTPMAWAAGDAGPGPVVAEQERDPDSLLHFFRRMLRAYRGRPELGRGAVRLVDVGEPSVLAHTMTWRGRTVLALHSLRDAPVTVTVPDGGGGARHRAGRAADVITGDRARRRLRGGAAPLRQGLARRHLSRNLLAPTVIMGG
ncbi:MAG: hypothetical protein PGN11_06650 [Quadrisphaera sp.]